MTGFRTQTQSKNIADGGVEAVDLAEAAKAAPFLSLWTVASLVAVPAGERWAASDVCIEAGGCLEVLGELVLV